MEPIKFFAALSGQSSAARWLSVAADGSCKLVLECDAQQLGEVLKLATLGGKLLSVEVKVSE